MFGYRLFIRFVVGIILIASAGKLSADDAVTGDSAKAAKRPNIFIAISDDQSWPHASAYGSKMVSTPNFDRVAKEGILFTQAFCPSPGCSPSRAAFLTGRNTWQIEHAGTHASYFDPKYVTFPDQLASAGYFVGSTGKGWGPGDYKKLGRTHNPAGPSFGARQFEGHKGYAAGFAKFLSERPKDKPFCFWFGSSDPHRSYKKGSGLAKGKTLEQAEVPGFLPDTPEIRSDMLDYTFEVERFDSDLGQMLELLKKAGELDNTLVIATSDNGCPIPRAKANCYEYGIHMPLAIRGVEHVSPGRTVDDLVGFTDLTATIYDIVGVEAPSKFPISGRSIRDILKSKESGVIDKSRREVYSARERHSSSRFNSLSYPQRCIRTHDYLYIRNFKPERWPAGPAEKYAKAKFSSDNELIGSTLGPLFGGYHDIDACPSLTFLIQNRAEPDVRRCLTLAVGKRPAEELFDIRKDPFCLNNLAGTAEFAGVRKDLSERLINYLKKTGDARVTGNGDVWESYPRVSGLRWFPAPRWATDNPEDIPKQDWVDARRPK
jgi:N-sulfoglucosamine sulfohydrolase